MFRHYSRKRTRTSAERQQRREAKEREDKKREDKKREIELLAKKKVAYAILEKHNAYTEVNILFVDYAIGAKIRYQDLWERVGGGAKEMCPQHGLYRAFYHFVREREGDVPPDLQDNSDHSNIPRALSVMTPWVVRCNPPPRLAHNISPELAALIACYPNISDAKYRYALCTGLAALLKEKRPIIGKIINHIVNNPEMPLQKDFLPKLRLLVSRSHALMMGLHPRTGGSSLLQQVKRRSSIFDSQVLGIISYLADSTYSRPGKKASS